jgi:predicted RNA-binding protein with TRAM domain
VIVPGGQPGDELSVEIEQAKENVAFASIVERDSRAL